jgi:hypothetical protein
MFSDNHPRGDRVPAAVIAARVEEILPLVTDGASRREIMAWVRDKTTWGHDVGEKTIDRYMARANRLILKRSEGSAEWYTSQALERYQRLFWRASKKGDLGECRQTQAEIVKLRATVPYVIRLRPIDGELVLSFSRYFIPAQEIVLDVVAGRAICALCPHCGKAVRRLYLPPEQEGFRCRSCSSLVYRSAANPDVLERLHVRSVAARAMGLIENLPKRVRHRPWRNYVEQPPAALATELARELPLGRQELHLWCLRLRAVGLSYRQIARLTESSKSTVARLCVAGRASIDQQGLTKERMDRADPRAPRDDDLEALAAYAGALSGQLQSLGLCGATAHRLETRTVFFLEDDQA